MFPTFVAYWEILETEDGYALKTVFAIGVDDNVFCPYPVVVYLVSEGVVSPAYIVYS